MISKGGLDGGDGGEEMLSTLDAAERLDVPVRRIYELVHDGTLPGFRGERSTVLVSVADVEALERSRGADPGRLG